MSILPISKQICCQMIIRRASMYIKIVWSVVDDCINPRRSVDSYERSVIVATIKIWTLVGVLGLGWVSIIPGKSALISRIFKLYMTGSFPPVLVSLTCLKPAFWAYNKFKISWATLIPLFWIENCRIKCAVKKVTEFSKRRIFIVHFQF